MNHSERREIVGFFLIMIALVGIAIAATGCAHPCPKCPAPLPPAPVVTVVAPPPCLLPELPAPIAPVGVPMPDLGGYLVPQASWALLGGYQSEIRAWITAAAGCLTRGQVHP